MISGYKSLAKKVEFDSNNMILEFVDGRILFVPLAFFSKLLKANDEQRKLYTLSGGGTGLHWDELDEDISVMNLLLGFGDTTVNNLKPDPTAA